MIICNLITQMAWEVCGFQRLFAETHTFYRGIAPLEYFQRNISRYSFNISKTCLNVTFEQFIGRKVPIIVILQDDVTSLIS